MVRRLPVGVLVGIAEPRHPERRRISERAAEVGRSGPCADRRLEGVHDRGRIVAEQRLGRAPRGPTSARAPRPAANRSGSSAGCSLAQRDEIDRLAPGGRFLGAARRHHLADHGRQHRRRVLPADQVEALERLVDEVERVPAIGEGAIGLGREQERRRAQPARLRPQSP